MMHTFRLLNMAEEIAREGKINVRRPDRDLLLRIRSGHYEYEQLVGMANEKVQMIEALFRKSDLPEVPDADAADELLVRLRETWYK